MREIANNTAVENMKEENETMSRRDFLKWLSLMFLSASGLQYFARPKDANAERQEIPRDNLDTYIPEIQVLLSENRIIRPDGISQEQYGLFILSLYFFLDAGKIVQERGEDVFSIADYYYHLYRLLYSEDFKGLTEVQNVVKEKLQELTNAIGVNISHEEIMNAQNSSRVDLINGVLSVAINESLLETTPFVYKSGHFDTVSFDKPETVMLFWHCLDKNEASSETRNVLTEFLEEFQLGKHSNLLNSLKFYECRVASEDVLLKDVAGSHQAGVSLLDYNTIRELEQIGASLGLDMHYKEQQFRVHEALHNLLRFIILLNNSGEFHYSEKGQVIHENSFEEVCCAYYDIKKNKSEVISYIGEHILPELLFRMVNNSELFGERTYYEKPEDYQFLHDEILIPWMNKVLSTREEEVQDLIRSSFDVSGDLDVDRYEKMRISKQIFDQFITEDAIHLLEMRFKDVIEALLSSNRLS